MESQIARPGFSTYATAWPYLSLASIFATLTFVTFISWRVHPSLPERLCIRRDTQRAGIDARIAPDQDELESCNGSSAQFSQFLTAPLQRAELTPGARAQKRLFDVVFSAVALLLTAIPMFAIALFIKIDSPGPVFYSSRRVGRGGRAIQCTKFRTMIFAPSAQGELRITRVGRFLRAFSLQQLPQIIDVLRGDLSLVGPRPPLASDTQVLPSGYLRRFEVTPGITGLWQVQAGEPSMYISLDRTYVENWSVWLDLKILANTFAGVLSRP